MNPELQRRFDAVERQRVDLQTSVLDLSAAQLNWKPDAKTWSAAQIIQHLALSEETVGRAQPADKIKNEAPLFRVLPRALRRALILRAMNRDTVLPLPSPDLEPGGEAPLSEWLQRWETARMESRRVLETLRPDDKRYSHPVLGPLNAAQMLDLNFTHTAYHTRQMETLRHSQLFPRRIPSPFLFEIEEHFTVKMKGIAVLTGKLRNGKIHVHDKINVPTQQGAIASGVIVEIKAKFSSVVKSLTEIEAGQSEWVGLAVSRLGLAMDSIASGQATNADSAE